MHILGLPEEDLPLLLKLTRDFLGADDPDRTSAELPLIGMRVALQTLRDYFHQVTNDRRSRPRDDLASVIATARINGEALPDFETVSYFIVFATGGHDTTTFAIVGGVHALVQQRKQLALLQGNAELLASAVDEMQRWTSPVNHFVRTATDNCRLGDAFIEAGELARPVFSLS